MRHPPRQPSGYRPGKSPCPGTRGTRIGSLNPGGSGEPLRGTLRLPSRRRKGKTSPQTGLFKGFLVARARAGSGCHRATAGVTSRGASPRRGGRAPNRSRVQPSTPTPSPLRFGAGAGASLAGEGKLVAVEKKKKFFFHLLRFAAGVTQCVAQDARRLIITLPTSRAGEGRCPSTLGRGLPGWRGGSRVHPMGARGDTWPLGAALRMGLLCPTYAGLAPNRAGFAGAAPSCSGCVRVAQRGL